MGSPNECGEWVKCRTSDVWKDFEFGSFESCWKVSWPPILVQTREVQRLFGLPSDVWRLVTSDYMETMIMMINLVNNSSLVEFVLSCWTFLFQSTPRVAGDHRIWMYGMAYNKSLKSSHHKFSTVCVAQHTKSSIPCLVVPRRPHSARLSWYVQFLCLQPKCNSLFSCW